MSVLGLNSMLGRTVVFALVLILATVTVAWISDRKVAGAAAANAASQFERVRISYSVRNLSDLLWHTQTQFQSYMIEPNALMRGQVETMVDDMIGRSYALHGESWVIQHDAVRPATQQLHDAMGELKSKLAAIMDIRSDPLKVFPAMTLMATKLNPLSIEFAATSTLGMQEAEDSASEPDQQRIGKLFADIRYFWSQRINTFRLLAASRLGMFNTSVEVNISTSTQNLDIFGRQLRSQLDQLHAFKVQGKLGLQQADALSELNRLFAAWDSGFEEVRLLLTVKDRWRRDIPMLREDIQPHFILLSEALRKIEPQPKH